MFHSPSIDFGDGCYIDFTGEEYLALARFGVEESVKTLREELKRQGKLK
jgi:hypothetical protein